MFRLLKSLTTSCLALSPKRNGMHWHSKKTFGILNHVNLAKSGAGEGKCGFGNSIETTSTRYSQTVRRFYEDTSTKPKLLRRLGKLEEFYFENGERYGWCTIINCLHFRSMREIRLDQIAEAMRRLQRRHDCLRMSVVEDDSVRYFAEVPDAVDLKVLRTSDVKTATETLEGERFCKGKLLWKVWMLQGEGKDHGEFTYPFIFAFQHCVVDGVSALTGLYPTLLDYLEEYAADARHVVRSETESVPMLPAPEHLYANVDVAELQTTPILLTEFATTLRKMYQPDKPRPVSGLEDFVVNASGTLSILKAAKQHQVTVNSVCVSAIAMGTFQFLTKIDVLKSNTLTFDAPFAVDLRRFADPPFPPQHAGAYHSECYHRVQLTSEQVHTKSTAPFWKLAQTIDNELKESMKSRKPILEAIKYDAWIDNLSDDESDLCDLFSISNVGNLKMLSGGKKGATVMVDKFICVNGGREPDLFAFYICTLNGKLQVMLSYSKMLVPDELAEMYIFLVKEQLRKAFEFKCVQPYMVPIKPLL